MKFFTVKLLDRLNSGDLPGMARAAEAWELVIEKYRTHLRKIDRRLPLGAKRFSADYCFHDAQLLTLSTAEPHDFAAILRQENILRVITYRGARDVTISEPDSSTCFSPEGVLWLYDEFSLTRDGSLGLVEVAKSTFRATANVPERVGWCITVITRSGWKEFSVGAKSIS